VKAAHGIRVLPADRLGVLELGGVMRPIAVTRPIDLQARTARGAFQAERSVFVCGGTPDDES